MSTKNVTLHDENGNVLLPATKTSRVTDANGTNLDTLLEDVSYFGDTVGNVTTADFNAQTDTVWNKTQVLSAAQQAQARTNIGAGTVSSVTVNGTTYTPTNGDVNLGTISGGGGGSVTVDTALSTTSTNPVQNKVIAAAIGDIETLLASI